MPKSMLSGRVEDDLLRWVTGYAIERGVSRTAVLEWALREARALAKSGVPDLGVAPGDGRSASVGRVRRAGARSSSGRAPAVARQAAGAPAEIEMGAGLAPPPVGPQGPARAPVALVNIVAMRKRLPRSLAQRDVAMGLVRVGGVVCRDVDAVVVPSEVEC